MSISPPPVRHPHKRTRKRAGAEDYSRGGWAFDFDRGEEGDKFKLDELGEADAQLLDGVAILRCERP